MKVKGYDKKIPFIYGIDYSTHDIPFGILAPSENYHAFMRFFKILHLLKYPLRTVVCDDQEPLKQAVNYIFPKAKIQTCQNHYLENLRNILRVRTDTKYVSFFNSLYEYVFNPSLESKGLINRLNEVLRQCRPSDILARSIITDIFSKRRELFAYKNIPGCPRTTNIIESFNSHLEGRLKSIKGFKSFHSAQTWLNAYILRRRTKPFTDCKLKFRKLNGSCSLSNSLKRNTKLPRFY